MAYSFNDAKVPSQHRTQYFEMFGNRAIYNDGWVATTTPPEAPWVSVVKDSDPINDWKWELYHVADDFSQANNVVDKHLEKLKEMQYLFYGEARKYDVLPIDSKKVKRMDIRNRPSLTMGRDKFTYYDGMIRIPEGTAPDFKNKSHSITAHIDFSEGDNDGMLVTQGGTICWMGIIHLQRSSEVCL